VTESYGSGSSGETRQRSQEVAQQGQQKASEYAEQGREKAKGQIATQKERASGELQGIARALQQTGSQLREQDQDSIGQYAEQAAEQVERLSNYLSEKDSEQLLSEVEDLARNRPAVFLGGAFILGAAAARFLKSSAGQTGDLREELKQEAREVQQGVVPEAGGSSSGGSSSGGQESPAGGGPGAFSEAESSYRVRGEGESR
jgi:hypothetical protein